MKEFDEYLLQAEPNKREKAEYWRTAIGLQKVDGLDTSDYLLETAKKHIEGDITIDEVKSMLDSYYKSKSFRQNNESEDRTKEADIVAAHITEILSEKTLAFSLAGLAAIHKRLFTGILPNPGQYRKYNISKKEWVLNGASVIYVSAPEIAMTLDYDFQQEKNFRYSGLQSIDIVKHIAHFVAGIWQIHPFAEGNTRTTALFTIKYLRKLGFQVDNTPFEEHSWYFRNALVRASYSNIHENIDEWYAPLEAFFRNLLMHEHNVLKNRYLHIGEKDTLSSEVDITTEKSDKTTEKSDKTTEKSDKTTEKSDHNLVHKLNDTSLKILNILTLNPHCTTKEIAEQCQITVDGVYWHIKKLKAIGILRRVGGDRGGYWEVLNYYSGYRK